MSKLSKLTKIFAAAGIVFNGVVTPDAIAFAKALEVGSPLAVESFITDHSQSEYVGDAIFYLADKGGRGGGKGKRGGRHGGDRGGGKSGKSDRDGGPGASDHKGHKGGFKDRGERGRPGIFGPPGRPRHHPPGQYHG
jgi:hypothetical protein